MTAERDGGQGEGPGGGMTAPVIEITYCRQCRWLLRAAWMAQELLSTFEDELGGVRLTPGTGGVFTERGRFPEITELKQAVRDHIAPEKPLGHADRPVKTP